MGVREVGTLNQRIILRIVRLRLDKRQDSLAVEAFDRLRNDWDKAGFAHKPEPAVLEAAKAYMEVDWPAGERDPCGAVTPMLVQALAHVQVAHRVYWRSEDEPGKSDELDNYLAITLSQLECHVS